MPTHLTIKKQRFVNCFLGAAKFNGAKAARLAGYGERGARQAAYELMREPEVAARIRDGLGCLGVSAEVVRARLTELALADPDDCFDGDGVFSIELARANRAMSSVRKVKYVAGKVSEIDFADPLKALELLGKAHGIFVENVNHSGAVTLDRKHDLGRLTTEELDAFEQLAEKCTDFGSDQGGEGAAEA